MKHSKFIFLPMLFFCAASILLLGSCSDEPVTCLKPRQFYVANMEFELDNKFYGGCANLGDNGKYEIQTLILFFDVQSKKLIESTRFAAQKDDPAIVRMQISRRTMAVSPQEELKSEVSQGFSIRERISPSLVRYKNERDGSEVTYYFDEGQSSYVIECFQIFENKPASCRSSFGLDPNVFSGTVKVSFGEEILNVNIKQLTHELFIGMGREEA